MRALTAYEIKLLWNLMNLIRIILASSARYQTYKEFMRVMGGVCYYTGGFTETALVIDVLCQRQTDPMIFCAVFTFHCRVL